MLVKADPLFITRIERVVALAARHGIPIFRFWRAGEARASVRRIYFEGKMGLMLLSLLRCRSKGSNKVRLWDEIALSSHRTSPEVAKQIALAQKTFGSRLTEYDL